MISNRVSAVIFSNSNDENLKELTSYRSMASLPFGGRYRLIDFSLSNIVNAGITDVGIITNENYRSLMDHVGSGIYWDLDRKNGGLRVIPPFITGETKYKGLAEQSVRALEYVSHINSEYVLVVESGTITNVDVSALINFHTEKNADVTFCYRESEKPDKFKNTLNLTVNKNGKVTAITDDGDAGNLTIGIALFTKSAFMTLVNIAKDDADGNIYSAISGNYANDFEVYGFKHSGIAMVMDSRKSFFESNMLMLETDVRKDLFNKKRPIYTKTRDDMPTRYGTHSSVKNSLIADGCIIDGTVKNSVLFRGVRVHKGAVVENSILMQGVEIRANAKVKYVVSDKNAVITANEPVCGTNRKAFIVKKDQMI